METVLCYLIKDEEVLMLFRNKRNADINKGKWIGVGGHIEDGESSDEALIREVYEETSLRLNSFVKRGIIDFYMDDKYYERTYVYTSSEYTGTISEFDEGVLKYFPIIVLTLHLLYAIIRCLIVSFARFWQSDCVKIIIFSRKVIK